MNVVAIRRTVDIFNPIIMSRLLENLNDAQLEAVQTTEGPLLVIAGAGSGKTRVLTRRLAHILYERMAEPYQLLAVTFTNKAAGEMRERVAELLGGELPGLQVSTFHSFCARMLRQHASHLGYDDQYTILDQADSVTLVRSCIKELQVNTNQFAPKAQLRKISTAKNALITAEGYAEQASGYFEDITSRIYKLYQSRLRECNSMDFDDLLLNAVVLVRDHESVGEACRQRYKYLLVDEYQDTNHVQYLLLRSLLGDHNNICVVGDEDQSIYGWRGADIRNILEFEKDFPGARTVKLEQNYRSTKTILGAASAVISHNLSRKDKTLWSDGETGDRLQSLLVDSAEDEAIRVVELMDEGQAHTSLNEMAVLYRTNAQSRAFEEQLRRRNLPYQIVGGISFYQRKEVKDIMAYLRLIANPKDDVSFGRIINYPKRAIGNKSVEQIVQAARKLGLSNYELVSTNLDAAELGTRAKRVLPFVELIEKYRAQRDSSPIDLLTEELIEDLKLIEEHQSEDKITGQTRIENVEALIEGMAEFARSNGEATLATYLSEISLFTDLDAYADEESKVTMMTIHAAKGLEYDTVFMVGLEEGLFPLQRTIDNEMELEEERRLFYVGATRARKRLYLASAAVRHRFGEVTSIPSRFLREIPKELVDTIDLRSGIRLRRPEPARQTSMFGSAPKAENISAPEGVHYEYEHEGLEGLKLGRIVQHPTFGRGKVVTIEGFGESLRLEIVFSGIGLKKIMAKYARLKLIG